MARGTISAKWGVQVGRYVCGNEFTESFFCHFIACFLKFTSLMNEWDESV